MFLTFLKEKGNMLCYPFMKAMISELDEILPLYLTKLTATNMSFLQHFRRIRKNPKLEKLETDEVELKLISRALESADKELGLVFFR